MSYQKIYDYFCELGLEERIKYFDESCATVTEAANTIGVSPARIAKTLAFRSNKGCLLVVMAGDAVIDNKKFKQKFDVKARMLTSEEVNSFLGQTVGGVCPFGIDSSIEVFLDITLQAHPTLFPACGSSHSVVELSSTELFKYSNAREWADLCKVRV